MCHQSGLLNSRPKFEGIRTFVQSTLYLQVLLAMEHDRFGFDFSVFDVDFVAGQHDRYGLADSNQVSMPVRNVLVSDSRGDIKHDDRTLALDVVAISETAKFLLASGILREREVRSVR